MPSIAAKERPILFSSPMVRALLAGRKTQTRRIIKPQPKIGDDGATLFPWASFWPNGTVHTWDRDGNGGQNWDANEFPNEDRYSAALRRTAYTNPCRYGKVGNRLWVRETFCRPTMGDCLNRDSPAWSHDVEYAADCGRMRHVNMQGFTTSLSDFRWRPSIHMPKWASRIALEITDVRVQQVRSISHLDAMAEGIVECDIPPDEEGPLRVGYMPHPDDGKSGLDVSPIHTFQRLWKAIYGDGSWQRNDWIWAITYKRVGEI